jgi:hypothetical protein
LIVSPSEFRGVYFGEGGLSEQTGFLKLT